MDFSKTKIRSSAAHHIMVNPTGKSFLEKYESAKQGYADAKEDWQNCSDKAIKKSEALLEKMKKNSDLQEVYKDKVHLPNLSDGCKTYLADLYTSLKYGRTQDIKSKYLEKGLHSEEDAITLYSLFCGKFYKKNKERKENEWISGEIDFTDESDPFVNDTKCKWDIYSFGRSKVKSVVSTYKWQGICYSWLWEKEGCRIINCLVDTPEHLIRMEEKKLKYDFVGTEEDFEEACKELRRLHIYDDITISERVDVHIVKRDQEAEETIKKRVEDCRIYLQLIEDGRLGEYDFETEL